MIRSTKNKNKTQQMTNSKQRQNKDTETNNNNNNTSKANLNSCSTMDGCVTNNDKKEKRNVTKTFSLSSRPNLGKKANAPPPPSPLVAKEQQPPIGSAVDKNKRKISGSCQHPNQQSTTDNTTAAIAIKKPERSHSFSLTKKITKIYNSITGSKDNLTKIPETEEAPHPFKFTRSFSMAAIPLRKSFNRSIRRPKLEQLSEESVTEKCTNDEPNDMAKSDEKFKVEPNERPQFEGLPKPGKLVRKNSTSSLISSLKQTFSNSMEKNKGMNPRWSASLASLQHIDIMVSYEDLSFINYDQFNTYEKQFEKKMSQHSLNGRRSVPMSKSTENDSDEIKEAVGAVAVDNCIEAALPQAKDLSEDLSEDLDQPYVVLRRPKKPAPIGSNSSGWDTNYDQLRNLYRQSLDNKQLHFLNVCNRGSFRFSSYADQVPDVSDSDCVDGAISLIINSEDIIAAKEQQLNSDDKSAAISGHSQSLQNVGMLIEGEGERSVSKLNCFYIYFLR